MKYILCFLLSGTSIQAIPPEAMMLDQVKTVYAKKQIGENHFQRLFEILKKTYHLNDHLTREAVCSQISRILEMDEFLDAELPLLEHAIEVAFLCQESRIESLLLLTSRGTRLIYKDGRPFAILKERGGNERECLIWHIAHFLDIERFIAPSCTLHLQGRPFVIQPYLSLTSYSSDQSFRSSISCYDYWLSNLIPILFGHSDLYSGNLAKGEKNIVFFDNEAIFHALDDYTGCFDAQGNGLYLSAPLINFLVDWPEGEVPLDEKTRSLLLATLQKWEQRWSEIEAYLDRTYLNQGARTAFTRRFTKIRNFLSFSSPLTVKSLVSYLYPNYLRGLEELQSIISSILGYPATTMQAHIFACNWITWWPGVTPLQRQAFSDWIKKYY